MGAAGWIEKSLLFKIKNLRVVVEKYQKKLARMCSIIFIDR